MSKITHHVELAIQEIVTKDVSGYSAKDDVPHLERDLNDFARQEMTKLSSSTGKRVTIKRKYTTIEE